MGETETVSPPPAKTTTYPPNHPLAPTAPTVPTKSTAPTAAPTALKGYFTCPPQTQQPKGYPVQQIPLQGMPIVQNQPYPQAHPQHYQQYYPPTQPGQIVVYPNQSTPLIIDASGAVEYLKEQMPSPQAVQQMQQNQQQHRQQHQQKQTRRTRRRSEPYCADCSNDCDNFCYCLFCCWIFDCLCCLCQ